MIKKVFILWVYFFGSYIWILDIIYFVNIIILILDVKGIIYFVLFNKVERNWE